MIHAFASAILLGWGIGYALPMPVCRAFARAVDRALRFGRP